MPQFNKVHVVVNPSSGQPEPILSVLNHVFREAEVTWDISIVKQAGDGKKLAAKALEDGADLVAAYGGDGTVGGVANALVGTDIPLLALPGGTGNLYTKALNIPQTLEEAAQLVQTGKPHRFDVGQIDDEYFILNMDVGLATELIGETPGDLKERFGSFGYVIYVLSNMADIKQSVFKLKIDGQEHELEAVACVVANCGTVGAVKLDVAVSPDDGLLDVFVLPDTGSTLRSVAMQILRLQENIEAYHWQAKTIDITSVPQHTTRIEGELLGETPVSIQVVPAALNVLVP